PHHLVVPQHAPMSQTGRRKEHRAGPCPGDRFPVGRRHVGVAGVVHDQRGYSHTRGELRDVDLGPAEPEPPLQVPLHGESRRRRQGEALREAMGEDFYVRGCREQHRAVRRESLPDRQRAGRAAQRMADDRSHRPLPGDRPQRHRELRHGGPPPGRLSVARSVVRDHAKAGRHERRCERAEPAGAAAPPVRQQHGRPRSPFPGGQRADLRADGKPPARGEEAVVLLSRRVLWRAAEDLLRPARGDAGSYAAHRAERRPDGPERRRHHQRFRRSITSSLRVRGPTTSTSKRDSYPCAVTRTYCVLQLSISERSKRNWYSPLSSVNDVNGVPSITRSAPASGRPSSPREIRPTATPMRGAPADSAGTVGRGTHLSGRSGSSVCSGRTSRGPAPAGGPSFCRPKMRFASDSIVGAVDMSAGGVVAFAASFGGLSPRGFSAGSSAPEDRFSSGGALASSSGFGCRTAGGGATGLGGGGGGGVSTLGGGGGGGVGGWGFGRGGGI